MKITELLDFFKENNGVNIAKTKIHCATSAEKTNTPLIAFTSGKFKEYQEHQNQRNFERDYILSLIYLKNNEWLFAGVYQQNGCEQEDGGETPYRYDTTLLDVGKEFIGKLIVEFDKNFRNTYLLLENHCNNITILEIMRDEYKCVPFPGFENVRISYSELVGIINSKNEAWYSALSNVKGVYLIADTNTGKLYVGSAYGSDAFWQRWEYYAKTGHGDDVELKKLLASQPNYAENFQYSVLEIHSMNTSKEEIIARENHWKECLLSRKLGYNAN